MAQMKEAMGSKRSYKKLSHMEIEPVKGENGGHIVKHHYHSDGMSYKAPEMHVFGKEEGPELMAHMAKHLKIQGEASGEKHAEPENTEEAASEPASENVNA